MRWQSLKGRITCYYNLILVDRLFDLVIHAPPQGGIMPKTRAIRFSDEEDRLIERFLSKNPFFDFSSLARAAILAFMKDPKITVTPIDLQKTPKQNEVRQ